MAATILVAPRLDDQTTLRSVLTRVAFYFARIPVQSLIVAAAADLHDEAREWLGAPDVPEEYDPAAAEMLRAIAGKVRFIAGQESAQALADDAHAILVWNTLQFQTDGWEPLRKKRRTNLAVFDVDVERTRQEAGMLAEAAHRFDPGAAASHNTSAARLKDLVAAVGGVQRAYLVATGPSATDAFAQDLSDGIGIVCNTVVLDQRLMDHVRPKVVTFADPIFHFGLSRYAARFRTAVLEQSRRHDFAIVVPERYVRHLANLLPELDERIIGLRFGDAGTYMNLDLSLAAYVRPRPNILTMQMFPLGASLAKELHLIGFDGREPNETYFWKHGSTVQLHDEMDGIKRVHPAFFDVDYDDYYAEHVASVESYVRAIEALGRKVAAVTPSHIPPLRARFNGVAPPMPPVEAASPVLVTVDPDWVDDFGHFGPLNEMLQRCARDNEWQFLALGSRALRPAASWQLPWFTHPTNNFEAQGVYGDAFRQELAVALETLGADRTRPVVFAFYTGALWHLPEIIRVLAATKTADIRFVVNLMRAHADIAAAGAEDDPRETWAGRLLAEALALADRLPLSITVDTEQLADDVEVIAGARPEVWPMMALADPGAGDDRSDRAPGPVRVYCPARPQATKGYTEFASLAKAISESDDADAFAFTARLPSQPTEVPLGIQRTVETLRSANVRLLDKELTEGEYFRALRDADIVVLPHHRSVFRTRTSAMLVDALRVGRPVVAARGTWLGNYVELFDAGEVFEEGDVEDLVRAVRKVAGDIDGYLARLQSKLPEIEQEFSSAQLFNFLTESPDRGHPHSTAIESDVRAFSEWTTAVYQARRQGHAAAVAARVTAVERHLAATLALRTRDMQIDRLKATSARDRATATREQKLLARQVHREIQRAIRAEKRLATARANLQATREKLRTTRQRLRETRAELKATRSKARRRRSRG